MNIYDIARKSGVSSATVSRVINDSAKVRPETAEKVRRVMAECGFTPNVFARSLQSNSMKVLAVLTVDISDIYFAVAVQEIERYAKSCGYDIQVSFAGSSRKEQAERIQGMLNKRVDGLILTGSTFSKRHNEMVREAAQHMPVSMLNGFADGPNIYSVLGDDSLGIQLAVDHLVERGRKHIVCVPRGLDIVSRAKIRGYKKAMRSHGLDPQIFSAAKGIPSAFMAWLRGIRGPGDTAVVAGDDPLAIDVIKAARSEGLRVPTDLAVTGFDNLAFATASSPELTTVDGHARQMSRTVAKMLIDRLEGHESAQLIKLEPTLVIRESSS